MTHAYRIGDRLRLRGGTESAAVIGLETLVSGEPAYRMDQYLPGSGADWIGESALEPADDAGKAEAPASAETRGARKADKAG